MQGKIIVQTWSIGSNEEMFNLSKIAKPVTPQ
jgi:hypothetical protein